MAFHEVRFPTEISRRSSGGPERRTDIVTLGSGHEERNSRWADSRRSYNAGYGIRSLEDVHVIVAFYEERRGRLHGFRWRDHTDDRSCTPGGTPTAFDCEIGTGDGAQRSFQLIKRYGRDFAPWSRAIRKPVDGTVLVAVDGVVLDEADVLADPTTGLVTLTTSAPPATGARITAGFRFDVPVRFDTDRLEISLSGLTHGAIPSIPIIEVRT